MGKLDGTEKHTDGQESMYEERLNRNKKKICRKRQTDMQVFKLQRDMEINNQSLSNVKQ